MATRALLIAPGSRLGPYEITAKLGEGGMGEVFRAHDSRLHRDVALKVLPAAVGADTERLERFRREAQAVAALNHPNIVTLYSIEEAGEVRFLTMELVEGSPLDAAIPSGGLDLESWLEIGIALADAVAAAHAKGIVHRDLKPANVMIGARQRVKVLDFGLAKMAESGAETSDPNAPTLLQTREGVVLGTLPYMSPEQVRGRPLDERTDLFSLGVILYEMATGVRPFRGETAAELGSAILRDPPPLLAERREALPTDLERILRRCLEKDPRDRMPSARALHDELRLLKRDLAVIPGGARGAPAALADPGAARAEEGLRVAVLPFKGSGDAEMESFAEGLGEEISTGLSRFRYLSVVASASAARLQGEARDDRELGARLGARYVLEGSLRKAGSAIRVTAQLVDAQTGARLWAETYSRDLQTASIFAVQDDVAARIVATVADSYGVLVHAMRSATRRKDDADLTPVEWQFQYFAYREQITPAAHAELGSRLERAVARNDRQSDLHACLAQLYVDEYAFGFRADASSLDRALAAARRGVELDRANQFALVALAQVHFFRRDLAAFGPTAERAMALNPLNTDAVGILGLQIVHTGEFRRGTSIVLRAMELNPNHAGWMHFAPLWDHFHEGEYEQALERANRVDVPGLFWPYLVVASACGHLGRRTDAEAAVRDLLALDPEFAAHARSNIQSWHFASGLLEPLLDGLRKAGLAIPEVDGSAGSPSRSEAVPAVTRRAASGTGSGPVRAEEGFWVAVLPFRSSGKDAELTALSEGLTEEIVTGLSRFSYLRVIARSPTSHDAQQAVDVRAAGKALGARYVMEGSLRKAGTKVRLAVQLVDATTGAHLWAENYERSLGQDSVFELQDDLVSRIVATSGDRFGVLARSISEAVRGTAPDQLGPYEALMRGFGYHHRLTSADHAEAREVLERAVERAPSNADCWAMLSWITAHEHAHGFNVRPGSLDRALAAARRAVDIAPSNQLAQQALAVVLFFRKETAGCLSAAERAIALNPLDTSNEAMFLIAFTGAWERGCSLVRRAMELNPHHPRWYGLFLAIDEYRRAEYRAAVDAVVKANAPDVFWTKLLLAASHGQLGESENGRVALRDLLAQKPDLAASAADFLRIWFEPQLAGHLLEGLRKTGLETPLEKSAGLPGRESSSASVPVSGADRADEGFWVAVLPFKYCGKVAELAALAEGLTEDVVTGLSRFSYLRVIGRSSTSRLADEAVDVRAAGKALGARYVIEGSLRQAGSKLRLVVQLVDATTGAHLWAESYERTFDPEAAFELQDDLVPRIVSTVADSNGVLPRTMSEALRSRDPEQLSPYEAVLRSFGYGQRITPEELASSRFALESAVRKAPAYADAWAMLSWLHVQDHAQGFDLQADSLARGVAAAQRAVEAAPTNALAYFSLAPALFFQRELQSFRNAAERAVALNPMDGTSIAFMGELLTYAGDRGRGLELAGRAKALNPNFPGWYWYADFYDAYNRRDWRGALDFALKVNLPGHWFMHAAMAAACGQLGERQAASKALREVLKLRSRFAVTFRADIEKWWEPAYVGALIDGWRKAGLETEGSGGGPTPSDG